MRGYFSLSSVLTAFLVGISSCLIAQTNIVTYAGNDGKETFYDVTQLSDGTVLVAGYCESLNWIAPGVNQIQLTFNGQIQNALGTNRYGILCHCSDLSNMLDVVYFSSRCSRGCSFYPSLPTYLTMKRATCLSAATLLILIIMTVGISLQN
ncbi:MAG: hypothetical protein R2809_00205 [Flavobacteriales bacterium]